MRLRALTWRPGDRRGAADRRSCISFSGPPSAPGCGPSRKPVLDCDALYEINRFLYDLRVPTMNISAARENLPDAVERARSEPVVLERYGRPAAVLVSPEHYARLVAALEDAEDVEAFDAAMAEEGPNIPWEQAKADLGWE